MPRRRCATRPRLQRRRAPEPLSLRARTPLGQLARPWPTEVAGKRKPRPERTCRHPTPPCRYATPTPAGYPSWYPHVVPCLSRSRSCGQTHPPAATRKSPANQRFLFNADPAREAAETPLQASAQTPPTTTILGPHTSKEKPCICRAFRTGATGVKPWFGTTSRFGAERVGCPHLVVADVLAEHRESKTERSYILG